MIQPITDQKVVIFSQNASVMQSAVGAITLLLLRNHFHIVTLTISHSWIPNNILVAISCVLIRRLVLPHTISNLLLGYYKGPLWKNTACGAWIHPQDTFLQWCPGTIWESRPHRRREALFSFYTSCRWKALLSLQRDPIKSMGLQSTLLWLDGAQDLQSAVL